MKKEKLMAKRKMLEHLRNMMREESSEEMGKDIEDMKKVTVESDSPEGLEEGLDKAKEILRMREEMMKDKKKK